MSVEFVEIRKQLMEKLDLAQEFSDEEILEMIDELLLQKGSLPYLSLKEKDKMRQEVFNSVRKLDILQELMEDNEITEIMVNGANNIFIEKNGKIRPYQKAFSSSEKLEDVIQQIVGKCNRVVNESSPIVDARLDNGSRVNVVVAPVALNGPILTIRRFPEEPITMDYLISLESITREAAEFLEQAVKAKYSMMISGATSSGKTTFLNALSNYIPKDERIITIEDNAELQIQGVKNLVRLETKNANTKNSDAITMRELIKSALRMRPDRIVVGEVRGAEALDLLQAFNTGHEGSLSTAHANSARDMIYRMETMVLMGISLPLEAIQRQIAGGVELMIHLGRLKNKKRVVMEIVEIRGIEHGEVALEPIFQYQPEKGLLKVGELLHKEKIERAGVIDETGL